MAQLITKLNQSNQSRLDTESIRSDRWKEMGLCNTQQHRLYISIENMHVETDTSIAIHSNPPSTIAMHDYSKERNNIPKTQHPSTPTPSDLSGKNMQPSEAPLRQSKQKRKNEQQPVYNQQATTILVGGNSIMVMIFIPS